MLLLPIPNKVRHNPPGICHRERSIIFMERSVIYA